MKSKTKQSKDVSVKRSESVTDLYLKLFIAVLIDILEETIKKEKHPVYRIGGPYNDRGHHVVVPEILIEELRKYSQNL